MQPQKADVINFQGKSKSLKADPSLIIEEASHLGFVVPDSDEIRIARDTAASLIDLDIAAAIQFERVYEHSGIAILVFKESGNISGMMALMLLNRLGHEALQQGHFDAKSPALDHLCKPGDHLYAGYGWGFAATTKIAGRAVVHAFDSVRKKHFSTIPIYTRAATEDGKRIIVNFLGYRDVPWPDDTGLIWLPGISER